MNPVKPWWTSTTIWVNGLTLLSLGAMEVQKWELPDEWKARVVAFLAVVNLLLRVFKTSDPVKLI